MEHNEELSLLSLRLSPLSSYCAALSVVFDFSQSIKKRAIENGGRTSSFDDGHAPVILPFFTALPAGGGQLHSNRSCRYTHTREHRVYFFFSSLRFFYFTLPLALRMRLGDVKSTNWERRSFRANPLTNSQEPTKSAMSTLIFFLLPFKSALQPNSNQTSIRLTEA